MRKFALALLCVCALHAPAQAPVSIKVDLSKKIAPYKPIYSWFGYDEGNYTTMKHGRMLLKELHDLSPVPVYIRAHHLLTSGNGVPELKWSSTNVFTLDANGKPVYDFKILDEIFDSYKSAGVRPMVELGFMPKDLAANPEPYQVHYPAEHHLRRLQQSPKGLRHVGRARAQGHRAPRSALRQGRSPASGTSRSGTSPTSTIGTPARRTTSSSTTTPSPVCAPPCPEPS